MPKVVRCCVCGRLCGDIPHNAQPYKNGYACDLCHITYVRPAIREREEKLRRKYRK